MPPSWYKLYYKTPLLKLAFEEVRKDISQNADLRKASELQLHAYVSNCNPEDMTITVYACPSKNTANSQSVKTKKSERAFKQGITVYLYGDYIDFAKYAPGPNNFLYEIEPGEKVDGWRFIVVDGKLELQERFVEVAK